MRDEGRRHQLAAMEAGGVEALRQIEQALQLLCLKIRVLPACAIEKPERDVQGRLHGGRRHAPLAPMVAARYTQSRIRPQPSRNLRTNEAGSIVRKTPATLSDTSMEMKGEYRLPPPRQADSSEETRGGKKGV